MQFLKDHPSIRSILLHLDNDAVGRSAAKGILQGLAGKSYDLFDLPPSYGKDVNEQLQILKKKEYPNDHQALSNQLRPGR